MQSGGDMESSVGRPSHELKGFTKVYLEPRQEEVVELTLHKDSFGFYDVDSHGFVVEAGEFEIQVAASSRDIRLKDKVYIDKEYRY